MPDWGRETRSGAVVHIGKADRARVYVCPVCRIRLELRRGSELEYFAHWRGLQGTRECELFSPSAGNQAATQSQRIGVVAVRPDVRVEDNPLEAGLLVDVSEGRWAIALRLPVLQGDELGELSLADLRPANVEVAVGRATQRVSALELLSGEGAARVVVPPDVATYRATPCGTWPASVDTNRWRVEVRGLAPNGTLFRLRRGDWTRLLPGSGVHLGDAFLVVAETRSPPPSEDVREVYGHDVVTAGRTWRLWELCLTERSATWLSDLGHMLVPRRWSIASAMPARSYTDRREPVYWIDDTVVLVLDAPAPNARIDATLTSGSNTYGTTVVASEQARAYVALLSTVPGRVRLQANTGRLDLTVAERPSIKETVALLGQTPRLQVWIGERCFEAWTDEDNRVLIDPRAPVVVRVELGGETVRVSVTVWRHGRRRSWRSLSDRDVVKVIEEGLATASLIEVDGENLGRVTLAPTTRRVRALDVRATHDRLEGYARSLRVLGERHAGDSNKAAIRAASLVRGRLAAPRRDGTR